MTLHPVIKLTLAAITLFLVVATACLSADACVKKEKGKVKLNVPKTEKIKSSSNKICQQNGDEKVCYRKNKETGEMELVKASG